MSDLKPGRDDHGDEVVESSEAQPHHGLRPGRALDVVLAERMGYSGLTTVYAWADRKKRERPQPAFLTCLHGATRAFCPEWSCEALKRGNTEIWTESGEKGSFYWFDVSAFSTTDRGAAKLKAWLREGEWSYEVNWGTTPGCEEHLAYVWSRERIMSQGSYHHPTEPGALALAAERATR